MAPLEAVFNHLVLPPKLPARQDANLEGLSQEFVQRLSRSCLQLETFAPPAFKEAVSSLALSLIVCGELNHGRLDRNSLISAFETIKKQPLILYIVEQNAALFIRPDDSHGSPSVIFEAFEASPPSEDVLASENALLWSFPDRASQIPLSTFNQPDFQDSLADFLEKASMDGLTQFTSKTRKANVDITEVRDTTDPSLVTQMLMPLLDTLGSPAQVPLLPKRVRDDVSIDESLLPWRRHPFWLILRVAAQRQLCLDVGDLEGRALYKMLIVITLTQLMIECSGKLRPELTLLLRSKICRRLAKLEMEKAQQEDGSIYHEFFGAAGTWLKSAIDSVTEQITLVWNNFKAKTTRKVERLPSSASPSDLRLSLPASGEYLDSLLRFRPALQPTQGRSLASLQVNDEGIKQVMRFTKRYFDLADVEKDIQRDSGVTIRDDFEEHCVELAQRLCEYLDHASAYNCSPEHMSSFILNLFDLWTMMDAVAVRADPLLRECHPVFTPSILDALQLPNARDLPRLQAIQQHIQRRVANSRRPDIFASFDTNCFAYQSLVNSEPLQSLQEAIQEDCEEERQEKQAEWEKQVKECDDLTASISSTTCVCLFQGEGGSRTKQDIASCRKCFFWRTRNRLDIKAFEEYLPDTATHRAGIVFELYKSRFFEAYRNATWRLIRDVTYPTTVIEGQTPLLLRNFEQLQPYMQGKNSPRGITLASTAKSFKQSHFGELRVRHCSLEDVILPFGPQFQLWDEDRSIWVADLDRTKLTLQHHCSVFIPGFLNGILPPNPHPPAVVNGPASYQLMANQRQCPQQASLHEFSAYQRLLFGTAERWVNILVELGSSNLNLSSGDTTRLLAELAVQAGPASEGQALRDSALVFQDPAFCDRLVKQIEKRLSIIRGSWRECNCMELLITLSERLHSLARSSNLLSGLPPVASAPGHHLSARSASMALIRSARKATLGWINHLREEVKSAKDASTAERLSTYAFRAAILCRRTFAFVSGLMSFEDLSIWCQATVALQEFIPGCLDDLKPVLIRDTKMAYTITDHVRSSVEKQPSALTEAIKQAWGYSKDDQTRTSFSTWEAIDNGSWFAASMTTTTSAFGFSQNVQFNFVEGYLLVDGHPVGKLSYKIRNSPEVKELFGDACLRTFPSNHDGMSYRLAGLYNSQIIHFGLRNDEVVIRAVSSQGTLEFIPRRIFSRDGAFDLPVSLIHDKVHWLNLSTKRLVIRPRAKAFKARRWDWFIDLPKRECKKEGKGSRLVDPNSILSRRVAKIFEHFEQPERITIVESANRHLSVDLTRFELSFIVNPNQLLYETKLKMELDANQDAGCLYGLESKIVLRDVKTGKRSVIVPLGTLSCRLAGPHVQVKSETSGNAFSRFEIDPVLGRLTCAPEPPLVFALAHFHAITSFPLPDTLTSKTGLQASMEILQSGAAQPWQPIGFGLARLGWIGALAPEREFYPKDKARLQQVRYNANLTMHVQHDGLETLAQNLIRKSRRLQPFFQNTDVPEEVEPPSHLRRRGMARRSVFEPMHLHADAHVRGCDKAFQSRGSRTNTAHALNVIQISKSIFSRPLKLEISQKLEGLLKKKIVGGFLDDSGPPSLTSLMEGAVTEQWGSLVEFSRTLQPDCLFGLAFRLGLLAFDKADEGKMDLLQVLVAIARVDSLKVISPPAHPVFIDFGTVNSPDVEVLEKFIRTAWPEFQPYTRGKRTVAAREEYQFRCEEEARRIARFLSKQWPVIRPSMKGFHADKDNLIDETEALEAVLDIWQKMHANRELYSYVDKLQRILDRYATPQHVPRPSSPIALLSADSWEPPTRVFMMSFTHDTVVPCLSSDLLEKSMAGVGAGQLGLSPRQFVERRQPSSVSQTTIPWNEVEELDTVLRQFTESAGDDALRKRYGSDLLKSLEAMRRGSGMVSSRNTLGLKEGSRTPLELSRRIQQVRKAMNEQRSRIITALADGDTRFQWLWAGDLWPGTDTVTLLEQLRSRSRVKFGAGMKESIIRYGLLIVLCQWLMRVKDAILRNETVKLHEYLSNTGHDNWDPNERPDWLLMEIDGDLLIRSTQVSVAQEIISPSFKVNSVFQLMMGQGKTSCIVPMAIAVLADSSQCLARLIVPKALVLASAHILQSRIGGLVGRSVRHIPFSRRTPTSMDLLRLYSDLHREARREAGVLLTTPDHVLSFKLSGLQSLVDGDKPDQAKFMIRASQELTKGCRDIIDESDLNLGIKTQLIYPSGPRMQVDGSPQRWEVAEELLILVAEHVNVIRKKFPRGLEIVRLAPKGFPVCYFLQKEAEDELHRFIVDDICNGRTPFLRPAESTKSSENMRQYIRRLLTEPNLRNLKQNKGGLKEAINLFADPESAWKILLLMRGLLLNRVLLLCLKKRWNVQYGLHPSRDPVAVPYHSRGVPSEQAEFGHPDVTILLTSLSYFYGGLSLPQFVQSLRHVLKSDDPSTEYDRFVSGCTTLPDNLRHYYVINADDSGQVEELFGYLRLDRSVIVHFMNHFVFPIHSKAFLVKMSASSWDIPLLPRPGLSSIQHARTSGFSGTNDNRALLPLTITQNDLPGLLQTNAEVLSYLLQQRNRGFHLATNKNGQRLTEPELLAKLADMRIRVLIDAGAYVLEMSNEALMKTWLDIDHQAKAGAYFDQGRTWVMHRGGKKLPLVATPWANNINHDLLVFFDEAHCRGVDLKLFPTARAALTLAIGQTKDATVQAAMRLRELATTQAVTFIAPPEVDASVRDICKLSAREKVQSCHVVQWLLEQTCRANEQLQNLHIAQGVDFSRRQNAQWRHDKFLSDEEHRSRLLDVIQGQERQTLEQQYGPSTDAAMKGSADEVSFPCLKEFMRILAQQRNSIGEKLNGRGIHSSVLEEVEQEREVEFQVEEVRQVAKPVRYQPLRFPGLHATIRNFVRTGQLEGSDGFIHAFDSLRNTAIGKRFEVRGTDSHFYCSTEFSRTVVLSKQAKTADNFLRPVEWILWSPSTMTALLIIPEEAELLIPVIRRAGQSANVHLITYAAPVTKTMMHFNDLTYYAMPSLPLGYKFPARFMIELGMFAGRLYVSFEESSAIREYLQMSQNVGIDQEDDSRTLHCDFVRNPIAFLLEWLALRRQVQDIMQTPMGYILQGRALNENHPFFSSQGLPIADLAEVQISTSSSNDVSNDDDSDDEEDDWFEHHDDGENWEFVQNDEVNEKLEAPTNDDLTTNGDEPHEFSPLGEGFDP